MLNFRQFEAGPDPFGRKFQVMFKWLQTAISIRHSDTIDVKFVLVDENGPTPKPIIGFFSLNLCQIKSEALTADEAKKLPRDLSGIRLGRLAVAKAYQRQGIGKALLVAAMGKFMEIFSAAAGIGLFVDAKDQKAKRYYEQFGFVALPSNELELFLPVKTIQNALTPHS